jgi:hypothetical protein
MNAGRNVRNASFDITGRNVRNASVFGAGRNVRNTSVVINGTNLTSVVLLTSISTGGNPVSVCGQYHHCMCHVQPTFHADSILISYWIITASNRL